MQSKPFLKFCDEMFPDDLSASQSDIYEEQSDHSSSV